MHAKWSMYIYFNYKNLVEGDSSRTTLIIYIILWSQHAWTSTVEVSALRHESLCKHKCSVKKVGNLEFEWDRDKTKRDNFIMRVKINNNIFLPVSTYKVMVHSYIISRHERKIRHCRMRQDEFNCITKSLTLLRGYI